MPMLNGDENALGRHQGRHQDQGAGVPAAQPRLSGALDHAARRRDAHPIDISRRRRLHGADRRSRGGRHAELGLHHRGPGEARSGSQSASAGPTAHQLARPSSPTRLADVVRGRDAMDIGGAFAAMVQAMRNLGRPGVVGYALSAVDVALWDLKARLLDLPLHRLLGAVRERGARVRQRRVHHLRRPPAARPAVRLGPRAANPPGEDQDRRVLGSRRPPRTSSG